MKVLAISSYVASGGVGLRQAFPVLECAGIELIAQPTIILSQHLGHDPISGSAIPIADFRAMLSALQTSGALNDLDAILIGFLPTASHVEFVSDLIENQTRTAQPTIIIDPIFGDDPEGFYLPEPVPSMIREKLLPMATIATPNRFELESLINHAITDIPSAIEAARKTGIPLTFGTSIPVAGEEATKIATIAVTESDCWIAVADRRNDVPHGTGDLFAAITTRLHLKGFPPARLLARAVAILNAAIDKNLRKSDLTPGSVKDIEAFADDAPIEYWKA